MRTALRRALLLLLALAALVVPASALASQPQNLVYQTRMGQPFNDRSETQWNVPCNNLPCGVWNAPVGSTPSIDPESAQITGVLQCWFEYLTGCTSGGQANMSITNGIGWYIAPPGTTTTKISLSGGDANMQQVLDNVPIPAGAAPSSGSDERLAILQPTTGCAWETWKTVENPGPPVTWSAVTGGRTCNIFSAPGVYVNQDDLADAYPPNGPDGNVLEEWNWGGPATGFTMEAGAAMVDEIAHAIAGLPTVSNPVATNQIPHAIAFAIEKSANCSQTWAQPAMRTDGTGTVTLDPSTGEPESCIPEGAKFILPPPCPVTINGTTYNNTTAGICYNQSDLDGAPALVRVLAYAAQNYGFIDENSTAGGLVAVESGAAGTPAYAGLGNVDPYTSQTASMPNGSLSSGGLDYSTVTPFLSVTPGPNYSTPVPNQQALAKFPWQYMELATMPEPLVTAPKSAGLTAEEDDWYTVADPSCGVWPSGPC